jgi:hypothetical protein
MSWCEDCHGSKATRDEHRAQGDSRAVTGHRWQKDEVQWDKTLDFKNVGLPLDGKGENDTYPKPIIVIASVF